MTMKRKIIAAAIFVFVVVIMMVIFFNIGYGQPDKDTAQEKLVVVSPHPAPFIIPLINEFESETGIKVKALQCGTSKALELIKSNADIDVLWGGSILSVGESEGAFLPYKTENIDSFYENFKDVGEGFTCFTDVPSVLMINTDLIGDIEVKGYEDLLNPRLKGKIAFADPSGSSSSFEHLTNMLYAMGNGNPEDGWDYVEKFSDQLNGVILQSSSEVYEGVSSGKFLVGLTFEEAALTMINQDKHIKIVYMEEGILSTPDGVYINKNTKHADSAKKFVDFMTAYNTQKYITAKLGRRSVRRDVEASVLVTPKEELNIVEADRDVVGSSKNKWLSRFSDMMGGANE